MRAAPLLDSGLQRDVAILSTLAHLHCATVVQLHALCFPYHTLATARITLHYLAEASFINRSSWRLKHESAERGQVWTLAARGHDLLQQYVPHIPPLARLDLGRPSTAMEREEWRIRLQVRTLLLGLLLESRTTPLLHYLEIQLPGTTNWPAAWGNAAHLEPDALVSVVWHPAERQQGDWLPWLGAGPLPASAIHYPIFVERMHTQAELAELVPLWAAAGPAPQHMSVVILRNEDRYTATSKYLATLPLATPLRLATWAELDGGTTHRLWRDARGAARAPRLVLDEQVG